MKQEADGMAKARPPVGGLAGWLLGRLRAVRRPAPRLLVLERITLAPRQSLSLVEAEGRRFLVATSPEGTPAFYALDGPVRRAGPDKVPAPVGTKGRNGLRAGKRSAGDGDLRVSW